MPAPTPTKRAADLNENGYHNLSERTETYRGSKYVLLCDGTSYLQLLTEGLTMRIVASAGIAVIEAVDVGTAMDSDVV